MQRSVARCVRSKWLPSFGGAKETKEAVAATKMTAEQKVESFSVLIQTESSQEKLRSMQSKIVLGGAEKGKGDVRAVRAFSI